MRWHLPHELAQERGRRIGLVDASCGDWNAIPSHVVILCDRGAPYSARGGSPGPMTPFLPTPELPHL